MRTDEFKQNWVLVGTAGASKDVWGLRQISFPCGYSMPEAAYADQSVSLDSPSNGEEFVLGGLSLELVDGGKFIDEDNVDAKIAGVRPWLCVFGNTLLDELKERQHSITTWDKGVSIFYGLWRENCQALGELIPYEIFLANQNNKMRMCCGNVVKQAMPSQYNLKPADIIKFFSAFLTIREGDNFVLGPLVATKLPKGANSVSLSWADITFSKNIT